LASSVNYVPSLVPAIDPVTIPIPGNNLLSKLAILTGDIYLNHLYGFSNALGINNPAPSTPAVV
jgi:hypothetical protein